MIIDFHTHVVPEFFPAMHDRSGQDRWPVMKNVDKIQKNIMIAGKLFRTLTNQCWCGKQRQTDMLNEQVTKQVLSPMPELLSYWFEPQETLEFAKYVNEQIAQLVQQAPDKFYGLGMVPLQDPELAAKELPRLKHDFGLLGVEVGTNVNGRPIGDPFFAPFFEAAEKEGMTIFVHPLHPTGKERLVGTGLEAVVSFPSETAFAAASLITGGMLDQFPNLKIVFSHGGGGFAMLLPRLIQGWHTVPQVKELIPQHPSIYAQKLFYDTLVYDAVTLKYLIDMFGAGQLVVGSDYPFSIREIPAGHHLNRLTLDPETKKAIEYKNCMRLLGL
jgi:aminocarboxymuconate-semialdehyde decarboxylase